MTKQELVNTFYKLDKGKFKLFEKGVAFELVIRENGGFLHTGIGTGNDMTMMVIYSLLGLYSNRTEDISIEQFADSVRDTLVRVFQDNVFDIENIDRNES